MGFAERSGVGALEWALQHTMGLQLWELSGETELFISVNYICLGPELALENWLWQSWLGRQLGVGMAHQDVELLGSSDIGKSEGLCWSFAKMLRSPSLHHVTLVFCSHSLAGDLWNDGGERFKLESNKISKYQNPLWKSIMFCDFLLVRFACDLF